MTPDPAAHLRSLVERGYIIHRDATATCSRCGALIRTGLREDYSDIHDAWHREAQR